MEEGMKESVFRVVRFVASPLRFYAFAIAFILSAICVIAWKSTLPPSVTAPLIYFLLLAVGLLLVLVTFLIIFHPRKLIFDQEAHLTYLRERLGDNTLKETYLPGSLPSQVPHKLLETEVKQ